MVESVTECRALEVLTGRDTRTAWLKGYMRVIFVYSN